MLHTKIKDLKFRKKYSHIEKKYLVNTFLFKNIMTKINLNHFDNSLKKQIILKCLHKKKLRVKTRSVRRCVYTNRSRGVLRDFKISRSLLRELMGFGIIPGYKKASW
jgi:ribosomal protein S14